MCKICKAAKAERVALDYKDWAQAVLVYHSGRGTKVVPFTRKGATVSDFYHFLGMSNKETRKHIYQRRNHMKVLRPVADRIQLMVTSPHWYALVMAHKAKRHA